ncbi:DinB family protein [Pedobacter immunditicola]|uniref:DinB family protein n=1 Tax=Pedobacter immunditicola TaxID=3133440 RepID=UPI0030B32EFD
MKRLFLLLLTSLLAVGNLSAQTDTKSTTTVAPANGKDFLLNYYQQTFDALQKSVEGLSEAQLNFKPAADRWSISQCLEHIVMTEQMIFDFAKKGMEAPANPERKKDVKMKDEDVIKGVTDRSFKAKAPENIVLKGKYLDANIALTDLQNSRKAVLGYLDSVSVEDLRNHIGDSPMGPVDSYQALLFLAGHTARHTAQIDEVKADVNFPK